MEYSFYLLQSAAFVNTFARLTDKICASGKRAVVFCENKERLDEFDRVLWTFSTNAFVPHGQSDFGFEADQTVFLTDTIKNPNDSSVLILINNFSYDAWKNFDFEKIIFVFSDDLEKNANSCLNDLQKKQQNVNYWQQTQKGWESKV